MEANWAVGSFLLRRVPQHVKTQTMAVGILILVAVGCMSSLRLRYLAPAQVEVPENITSLAPIERTGSEFAPSGIEAAARRVADSPRFEVAEPSAAQALVERATPMKIGQPLSRKLASSVCREAETSGVLSLEKLDATESWDSGSYVKDVTETVQVDGVAHEVLRKVRIYTSRVDVDVTLFFKLYDCRAAVIDDRRVWTSWYASAEGYSPGDAKSGVADPSAAADRLSAQLGRYYADIVAPHYVVVEREYFSDGNIELREAAAAVGRDDWAGAVELWEFCLEHESFRIRGKAAFNLALAAERSGSLDDAVSYASLAYGEFPSDTSIRYLTTLKRRLRDEETLAEQMGSERAK